MSTEQESETVTTAIRVALLTKSVDDVQKKQIEMAEHGRNSMAQVHAELKEIGRRIEGLGPVSHKQAETDEAISRWPAPRWCRARTARPGSASPSAARCRT